MTGADATRTTLRERALDALSKQQEADRTAAAEEFRTQQGWAIERLRRELVDGLGIDLADRTVKFRVEWEPDDRTQPVVVIDGFRFRIADYSYNHCGQLLMAAIERRVCGHEVVGSIGATGRERAWADLGELVQRYERELEEPCAVCVAEAEPAHGSAMASPPPATPTRGELVWGLLRELVREELASAEEAR